MSVKNSFSIKDLENLSGIKAHTIRIWEKRYNLLEPERSDTNIRTYNLASLQKILNVALLNGKGYKVSKIAEFDDKELQMKVRELAVVNDDSQAFFDDFKLSMLNFDQELFDATYSQLLSQYSFQEVFIQFFMKLLEHIGLLWASDTITPAHEHFISTLIRQKLLINIERVKKSKNDSETTFVLFLPPNEIHDLGLLYVHFELLLKGHRSVYLGPSVPLDSLTNLPFKKAEYISYFTVEPASAKVDEYLAEISQKILRPNNERLHVLGSKTKSINTNKVPRNVKLHQEIAHLITEI